MLHGFSALQAAFAASGECTENRGAIGSANSFSRHDQDLRGVDVASLNLLSRVRTALDGKAAPVVQFVPCEFGDGRASIAHDFACAAAVALGRTLLIDVVQSQPGELLPDAYVPRLYHQCLSEVGLYSSLSQTAGGSPSAGGMFRMVVIDQASSLTGDTACVAAPFCTGTVLVIRAGTTKLAGITSMAARIVSAGGLLLGSVIADVPAWAMHRC